MLFSSFSITGWFYFSAKLRTPFCNWVAKEGEGIATAKHGLKIQQSHAPERWPYSLRVRGPHFASKVSYNAGAATDDCVGLRGLKAQQVSSPGQRPGYHVPIPYAL